MGNVKELSRRLPEDLRTWMKPYGDDLATIWRECPNADWLVHLALACGVGRTSIVHATAKLVAKAVSERRVPDLRINRAVVTTLKWLDGRADGSEAWAAGFAATEIAPALTDPADAAAARAAGCLAFACDDDADDVFYAHRAYAAVAADHASRALGPSASAEDELRAFLPLPVLLEAYDTMPPPPPRRLRTVTPVEPTPNPFYR